MAGHDFFRVLNRGCFFSNPARNAEGCTQNLKRTPAINGTDQRELSLFTSRSPSSTNQSTSDRPPRKRSCVSAITSNGPTPIKTPPVGPRLKAHDLSKNLPSCAARPGVTLDGTPTKLPRMSWLRLMPASQPTNGVTRGREKNHRCPPSKPQ